MTIVQKHLSRKSQIDLGSFYTPEVLVNLAFDIVRKNVPNTRDFILVDTSCGYGSFLIADFFKKKIGVDIDEEAINRAEDIAKDVKFFVRNSLKNVSRQSFGLKMNEKVVIIGNPPYNDTTSIIRHKTKDKTLTDDIDWDIKTRDLGMSFLLSYNKLAADYVCVLHPLSYLIKKANFSLIRNFVKNYKLVDGLIVSSHEFPGTSRSMAFPILIGFYKRCGGGMNYDYIRNFKFRVKDDGAFRLSDFDTIANYIQKYPNKKYLKEQDNPIARFWTLRDINALRRNRTFIDQDHYNTVYVLVDKFPYYCYVDVFKHYIDKMPYFIGNCDIIIDNDEFLKIRECFVYYSIKTNPVLRNIKFRDVPDAKFKIDNYFKTLLTNKFGKKYATDFD